MLHKYKIKNFFIVIVLLTICSCGNMNTAINKKNMNITSKNIPSWYLQEDEWGNILVGVGTATSSDLQMSYDKALLLAKKNLAAKIKSSISSEVDSFTEVTSKDGIKINTEVFKQDMYEYIAQDISGYKVANKKVITLSDRYRTFIKISYDFIYAKEVIINKAYENELINKID